MRNWSGFIQYTLGVVIIGGSTAAIALAAGLGVGYCILLGALVPVGVRFMAASLDTTKP